MEALAKSGFIEFDAEPAPDRQAHARTLERLGAGLDAHIPGIGGHCRRVSRYAAGIARGMALSREEVTRIRRAAAIHDIGKIEMPVEIVNKCGPLSAAEFEIVKKHANAGARLVAGLGDERLTAIVRHHHERFDGAGYPDGLAGKRIPLGARIVAVADTFDAVTSVRPYRPARSRREALDLIRAEAGAQLDPDVVAAFHDYCSSPRGFLLRAVAR